MSLHPAAPLNLPEHTAAADVLAALPADLPQFQPGEESLDNSRRAGQILASLLSDEEWQDADETDAEGVVTLALAGLLHLCDATGLDFASVEHTARSLYREQLAGN